jgi:FkbM family methyltransferase
MKDFPTDNFFSQTRDLPFDALLPQMVSEMLALPCRYTIVDSIDIDSTIVAVLAESLQEAIIYYTARYKAVPDFYLVDDSKKATIPLPQVRNLYQCRIIPGHERRRIFDKQLCVWANPAFKGIAGPSLTKVLALLLGRGIKAGFSVDSFSVSQCAFSYGAFYGEKIPLSWFEEHLRDVCAVWSACKDEDSRRVFLGALVARLRGGFGTMWPSSYPEYFHPRVRPEKGDTLLDGGLWDAGVIRKFAETVGPEGHIYGFEPLPTAFSRVTSELSPLPENITLEPLGLSDKESHMFITQRGQGSALVNDAGYRDAVPCATIDVDSYARRKGIERVDMIKLDVEGAEPDVLRGATGIIREYKPKLAISIYHEPTTQLLEIPKMILDLDCGYELYMGHHTINCFGTILYATARG